MAVEVVSVERRKGKVVKAVIEVGDIEIHYIRLKGSDEPYRESRIRHGVQVMDKETLRIPEVDFSEVQETVRKIFSEERLPRKKRTQEGIQGELIPKRDP